MAKVLLYYTILQAGRPLVWTGNMILTLLCLEDRMKLQLVFVMIILPAILNTIQYWVIDNYIKA